MVACSSANFKPDKCGKYVKVQKMTVGLPSLHISIPKKRQGQFEQGTITSQTSVNISPSDSLLPQDIGLELHTNVSIESKRSRCDIKSFLFLVLFLEVGFLHLYSYRISSELRIAEQLVSEISQRLNCLVTNNKNLQDSLKAVQDSYDKMFKSTKHLRRHSVYKRDLTSYGRYLVDDVEEEEVVENKSNLFQNRTAVIGSTKHKRDIQGPLLAHFKGALPEAVIQDGGVVAPWYLDNTAAKEHALSNILLKEGRGKVEIVEGGLYFIYAQVYYLTTEALNSFSIHVETEEQKDELVLATCSTVAASVNLSEVSCYTAVVRFLMPGDKIYILQRERNRRIVFRNGQTFFGVTMLNPGKTRM